MITENGLLYDVWKSVGIKHSLFLRIIDTFFTAFLCHSLSLN